MTGLCGLLGFFDTGEFSRGLLDVVELGGVQRLRGVLQRDYVLGAEVLAGKQVFPVAGLLAQLFDRLDAVDVTTRLDRHDVGVVREDLEGNRAVVLALGVFVERQLDQVTRGKGLACHWVLFVLFQVWDYVDQLEDYALFRADWNREWSEA